MHCGMCTQLCMYMQLCVCVHSCVLRQLCVYVVVCVYTVVCVVYMDMQVCVYVHSCMPRQLCVYGVVCVYTAVCVVYMGMQVCVYMELCVCVDSCVCSFYGYSGVGVFVYTWSQSWIAFLRNFPSLFLRQHLSLGSGSRQLGQAAWLLAADTLHLCLERLQEPLTVAGFLQWVRGSSLRPHACVARTLQSSRLLGPRMSVHLF